MSLKALVFDFDGLILDTETCIFNAWQELYARHACTLTTEDWLRNVGTSVEQFDPLADIRRQVAARGDGHASLDTLDSDLAWRWQRETELIAQKPPMPGVTALLQEASQAGLKIGLASSSPCAWVTGHLQRLGLRRYFHAIVAQEDVTHTKPDPELYRTAVTRLHVEPTEAIAFEDSLHGLLSAQAAGLRCVVAPNGLTKTLSLDHADWLVESLDRVSLKNLIERFA
jgi:HAD superfamily hydrolase (TIGR01509 family)